MSHRALNSEQFANHVHPHQLAIPGMEEHAHPWAKHLAQGYMLDMEQSTNQYHLAAVDVQSHPKYPTVSAELSWAKEKSGGEYAPGEVAMVTNFVGQHGNLKDTARGKGLAGALFHSAHHFNLGQSTVPIHSTERTAAGEHFANKVRPDLKPDVWYPIDSGQRKGEIRAPGKPDWAPPEWPGMPDDLHPFEKERTETRQAAAAKLAASTPPPGQGKLFPTQRMKGKRR